MPKPIVLAIIVVFFATSVALVTTTGRSKNANIVMKLEVVSEDELTIVITSNKTETIGAIPSLKLSRQDAGEEYWSPFDKRGAPLPLNGRVKIDREVAVVRLRLHDLRWAKSRSARWPSGRFRAVVPEGKYDVVARISWPGEHTEESNHAAIFVGGAGRK